MMSVIASVDPRENRPLSEVVKKEKKEKKEKALSMWSRRR